MPRISTLALALLLLASPASAQPTLGVYFDAEGTQTSLQIYSYPSDFTFYVVAKGVQDFKSVEFGLDYTVSVTRNVWWGPNGGVEILAGATNVCSPAEDDFCLGMPCQSVAGQPVVIAAITLQAFDVVEDYTICLTANSLGHPPGFVACTGSSSLQPLWPPYQGCAVLNPVEQGIPVRTASHRFGQVKALFRD